MRSLRQVHVYLRSSASHSRLKLNRNNMTLTIEEIDAHNRALFKAGDWKALWEFSLPLAKVIMKSMNLSSKNGVIIESIEDNSSAKYAGLLPKDVIVGIDNKDINNYEDLQKAIGLTKLNETIQVKIIRSGVIKEIAVRIRKGL